MEASGVRGPVNREPQAPSLLGSGSGTRSQKGFLLAHPKSGDGDGEDGELFLGAGGRAA